MRRLEGNYLFMLWFQFSIFQLPIIHSVCSPNFAYAICYEMALGGLYNYCYSQDHFTTKVHANFYDSELWAIRK